MLDFGNSGKLMPSELDSGMTTILADMSPSDAIQALADFDLTDLSTICNKSVYLHGLLRAAVDQPGGGGGGAGARPAAASGEGGATRSQDPCPHFHLVPIDGNVKCGHGFWLVRDSEFLLYIYIHYNLIASGHGSRATTSFFGEHQSSSHADEYGGGLMDAHHHDFGRFEGAGRRNFVFKADRIRADPGVARMHGHGPDGRRLLVSLRPPSDL
jgi:hypothetical protein